MNLKYMILGAGGTGGILGSALTKAGKDVTFIARGSNLDAMRNNGLIIRHLWDQTEEHLEVRALSMEPVPGCRKNYRIVPFWMDASMFLHP